MPVVGLDAGAGASGSVVGGVVPTGLVVVGVFWEELVVVVPWVGQVVVVPWDGLVVVVAWVLLVVVVPWEGLVVVVPGGRLVGPAFPLDLAISSSFFFSSRSISPITETWGGSPGSGAILAAQSETWFSCPGCLQKNYAHLAASRTEKDYD